MGRNTDEEGTGRNEANADRVRDRSRTRDRSEEEMKGNEKEAKRE